MRNTKLRVGFLVHVVLVVILVSYMLLLLMLKSNIGGGTFKQREAMVGI